jgi:hypothetical protein
MPLGSVARIFLARQVRSGYPTKSSMVKITCCVPGNQLSWDYGLIEIIHKIRSLSKRVILISKPIHEGNTTIQHEDILNMVETRAFDKDQYRLARAKGLW